MLACVSVESDLATFETEKQIKFCVRMIAVKSVCF